MAGKNMVSDVLSVLSALADQSFCEVTEPSNEVLLFGCGLTLTGSLGREEITLSIAVELKSAHERHHVLGHQRHGERWALIAEYTPDGLVSYCPESTGAAQEQAPWGV